LAVYDRELNPKTAETALAAIAAKHSGFLEAVCTKRGWHKGEFTIKDLLIDVFALIYDKQPNFRAPADAKTPLEVERAFRAWLCSICRNLFLRHLASLPAPHTVIPMVSEDGLEMEQNLSVMHPVLECSEEPGVMPRERN